MHSQIILRTVITVLINYLFSSLSRRKDKVVTGIKKIVLRSGVDASFWRVVTAFPLAFRLQSLRYFKQQKGRLKIFQTTFVLQGNF